jgi:hypothetical protein
VIGLATDRPVATNLPTPVDDMPIKMMGLNACGVIPRISRFRPGRAVRRTRRARIPFFRGVIDERGGAEGHHRTVVERVVEAGAGDHQPADMGRREGDRALLARRANGRATVLSTPRQLDKEITPKSLRLSFC